MPEYAVTFARSARRELVGLEPALVRRIILRIERLAVDPRPPGVRKLRGSRNLWRIRVGEYRIVYLSMIPGEPSTSFASATGGTSTNRE